MHKLLSRTTLKANKRKRSGKAKARPKKINTTKAKRERRRSASAWSVEGSPVPTHTCLQN
eukprot:1505111-Pleurochrysis_carterae.AAC.2